MEVFIIKKQSESDVITNSSSEVFIMHTDKSPKEVVEILSNITYGFDPDVKRFSLEEYKKALASEGEGDYFEYATPFYVAQDYFVDKKDKIAIARAQIDRLWWSDDNIIEDLFYYMGYTDYDPKHIFWNNDLNKLDKSITTEEQADKVMKWFEEHKAAVPWGCIVENMRDLNDLDGALMVFSKDDNTIPYEDFKKINSLFNSYNLHLG